MNLTLAVFCSPLTTSHERKYVTILKHFCFYERFIYYAWLENLNCEQVIEKPSSGETQDGETSTVTCRNQFRRQKESRFSGFGWISKPAMLCDVLIWVGCASLATFFIWNRKSISSPCSCYLLSHHHHLYFLFHHIYSIYVHSELPVCLFNTPSLSVVEEK